MVGIYMRTWPKPGSEFASARSYPAPDCTISSTVARATLDGLCLDGSGFWGRGRWEGGHTIETAGGRVWRARGRGGSAVAGAHGGGDAGEDGQGDQEREAHCCQVQPQLCCHLPCAPSFAAAQPWLAPRFGARQVPGWCLPGILPAASVPCAELLPSCQFAAQLAGCGWPM